MYSDVSTETLHWQENAYSILLSNAAFNFIVQQGYNAPS